MPFSERFDDTERETTLSIEATELDSGEPAVYIGVTDDGAGHGVYATLWEAYRIRDSLTRMIEVAERESTHRTARGLV